MLPWCQTCTQSDILAILTSGSPATGRRLLLGGKASLGAQLQRSLLAADNPSSLTLAQLEGMTYQQLNSSSELLVLAQRAGYQSVQDMLPGLGMFFDDVSTLIMQITESTATPASTTFKQERTLMLVFSSIAMQADASLLIYFR
jgi:hypothetical protein